MSPIASESAPLPENFIFRRLVTSGDAPEYDQILEACAVRADGSFAWPRDVANIFDARARRQFWLTPSAAALLRMRRDPTNLETGRAHADLVNDLHAFLMKRGPTVMASYGPRDGLFLQECGYRSLTPEPIIHPASVPLDIQLMAAAAALLEPEAIRFPAVKGDEIASLAATCAANGFDVDESDLLDARPFVAAAMALTMRLQERAPLAYAALLACADPAHVRSITKTEPFLHVSIRGGRAHVQPVQSIGPAAPGAPLRCVNVAGFLGQTEHELRAAKPPRDLRIVSIRGDRHEIVLPLTGSIYSETLRKLIRRPGIDRAFLPPSVDELQSCAGKLRAHGRFLDGFNDMFDRSVVGDGDWDTPPDQLSGQGPSPFAEDTLTRRMFRNASPTTRARLVSQIRDPRLREFARRIVWEHAQAENIELVDLADYLLFKRNRLLGCIGSNWRTVSAARKELDELARKSPVSGDDRYAAASC